VAGELVYRLIDPMQMQYGGPGPRPHRRIVNRELVRQRVGVNRREAFDDVQVLV
jgi:hypothetical protein